VILKKLEEHSSGPSPLLDMKPDAHSSPTLKTEEKQKKKSKRGRGTKRKHSIMDSLAASVSSLTPEHNQTKNSENSAPTNDKELVEKIVDESYESVIRHLPGWSMLDYSTFIEGLVAAQSEKDSNIKCKTIHDKFLPHLTLEEVRKCYSILQNAAKRETNSNLESSIPISTSPLLQEDAQKRFKFPQNPRVSSPDNLSQFSPNLPFGLTPITDPNSPRNFGPFGSFVLPNFPKFPLNVRYGDQVVPNMSSIESILKPSLHQGIDPFSTVQRTEEIKFLDENK